ncbi:hypothetical protein ACFE04_023332 [Oxalis oulophora]
MVMQTLCKCAIIISIIITCLEISSTTQARQLKSVEKDTKSPNQLVADENTLTEKKVMTPSPTPKSSFTFSSSDVTYVDTFRPTIPGNSPGVGHRLEQNKEDVTEPGSREDFRPTDPGRSPGAGHHPIQGKNKEPKA